jgi:16S rRNA (guanine1207-N2)-methyltransferase
MALHAALSVTREGGGLVVYGANDEGIGSAGSVLTGLVPEVQTLATGNRCRLLLGRRPDRIPGLRSSLGDWEVPTELGLEEAPGPWVSFPGVFSHGRVDPGTRILLDHLPCAPSGGRVLDFGCGSGIIGHVARWRGEEIRIELLDVDSVALQAARANVPGARLLLSDGLPSSTLPRYDLILSNPPFHRGKAEVPDLLRDLVRDAPGLLAPGGVLCVVVQRRFHLRECFEEAFEEVAILADDSIYRIWEGRAPRCRSR